MTKPHHDGFDPNCPGCRPALINPQSGMVYPADHPIAVTVNRVFDEATPEEQQAYYRVTVKNSRAPTDLDLLQNLTLKINAALGGAVS